jgi:hypothetical protein
MNPYLEMLLKMSPNLLSLLTAWIAVKKEYPQLYNSDILAVVVDAAAKADAAFDSAIAKLAAAGEAPPVQP